MDYILSQKSKKVSEDLFEDSSGSLLSNRDVRRDAGERSSSRMRRKSLILGLEPYLSDAVQLYEEASVIDIKKNPLHNWKQPAKETNSSRGKVRGFSAKSRMRLMKKLAECKRGEACLFVTLTVPWNMPPEMMKLSLWAFYKRLERKFPKLSMCWKMEPHKKGNWHFHLILFGIKYLPHRIAKAMWQDVIKSYGIKGAFHFGVNLKFIKEGDVQAVRNYVLKYMSKESEGEDLGEWTGRVWGSRGKLPKGERLNHAMTLKELIWFWRIIARKRKINVVKMSPVFFSDCPEIWIENAKMLAKMNEP